MNSGGLWTVLGLAATLLLGGWSIYLAFLGRRYPGRITFIQESCFGLFTSVVRNFPELVVSYQNAPVGQNLVLLKGAFLNSGTKDITPEMVADKLKVSLPVGYAWLTGKIVATSPKIVASVEIPDKSKLSFNLGLFRSGECIRFDALAEVPVPPGSSASSADLAGPELSKALAFEHRIADTRKVDREEKSANPIRRRASKTIFGLLCAMTIVCGGFLSYLLLSDAGRLDAELRYWLSVDDSKSLLVYVLPRTDGQVRVLGVTEKFDRVMSLESFFFGHKWKPTVARNPITRALTLAYALVLLLSAALALTFGIGIRREARIQNLLSISVTDERTTT